MRTTPVHCGWTEPLFIMAEQSLLAAVLLHQALNFFEYLQAGTGFPRGFPRFPTGPSLSSRFPDSVEPRRGIPAAAPNGLWFVHHPCRFRPDRAPWPPSSSTRSSTSASTPGGRRISSRSPSTSTGIPLPSRSWTRLSLSANIAVAAPDGLRFAHHPCRLRPRQSPLAAILLRQALNFYELPRRKPDFLEVETSISTGLPFPSRFLDSVEPCCDLVLGHSPGWTKVCP